MRPKIIVPAAAAAFIVLLLAFYLRFAPATAPRTAPPAAPEPVAAEPAPQAAAPSKLWAVTAHSTDTIPETDENQPSDHGLNDPAAEKVAQLTDLAMSSDPASLKTIVSELNDGNAQVRRAAVAATVQFGSADAIPALRNQLSLTDDPREKAAIQDAIDFLQLPAADSLQPESGSPPPSN